MSKFIVMLTYNDETVKNAKEVFDSCKHLPVEFWGFKNIGLPENEMKELVDDMKSAGKTTFLEVVTLKEKECIAGAEMAKNCGFDYLLGTVYFPSVFQYCKENKIKYLPFCGKVSGHPSVLGGSVEEIVNEAKEFEKMGCEGTDILAYRHKTEPEKLIYELCRNVKFEVVVAGSISTFERIQIVEDINPWAFTIGTALFDGKFGPDKSFAAQLKYVCDFVAKCEAEREKVRIVREQDANLFLDGPEVCRQYFTTKKITFGTSRLKPGERGNVDTGHPHSHEVFFVCQGHVILYTENNDKHYELFAHDAIIMPEGVPHTLINIGDEDAILSWSKAPSEL